MKFKTNLFQMAPSTMQIRTRLLPIWAISAIFLLFLSACGEATQAEPNLLDLGDEVDENGKPRSAIRAGTSPLARKIRPADGADFQAQSTNRQPPSGRSPTPGPTPRPPRRARQASPGAKIADSIGSRNTAPGSAHLSVSTAPVTAKHFCLKPRGARRSRRPRSNAPKWSSSCAWSSQAGTDSPISWRPQTAENACISDTSE